MKQAPTLLTDQRTVVSLILSCILFFTTFGLYAQSILPRLPVTNGPVAAIAHSGNMLYIGGNFTHVGPNIAYGIPIHKALSVPDLRFAMPNGDVYCALPDGEGGWYIGGTFSAVGGEERKNIARVQSDGSLHPWNPGVDGFYVRSMLISKGKLFIAGSFGIVDGQERDNLASFELNTGALTSWNANVSGPYVNSIAIKGNTLYVAGLFWVLGGAQRPGGLGAVDVNTGLATSWNPSVNNIGTFSDFRALAVNENVLYVGGEFTSLGGQPRMGLASLDATTAQVTSWNPWVIGKVNSLTIDHNFLYVGGKFNSINNQSRDNLASFHLRSGKLTGWKPIVNGEVSSIVLNYDKLYIGGYFTHINGITRRYLGVFYTRSGQLAPWSIPVNGHVTAIAFNSKYVYIGGGFTSIGGEARKNLAAIDVNTGFVLPWNPAPDNLITSLLVDNNKLYAGGRFNSIAGQSRSRLASFDVRSGQLAPWNPNVTGGNSGDSSPGSIERMVINSNTLYFIGVFTRVGGVPRRNFAAVNVASGNTTSFYPLTQETEMSDLALANGILYIGGSFIQMSGQPRTGLASFNLGTGQLTSWNPVVDISQSGNNPIKALAVWNQTVYIGGGFTTVNGESRQGLAAVDGNTGSLMNWNPNAALYPYSNVFKIATDGKLVYVGADFSPTEGLLSYDAQTGAPTNFHPQISNANGTADNGWVFAILLSGNRLYIGGEFTSVHQQPRPYFAGFDLHPADAQLLYFTASVVNNHHSPQVVVCNWSTAKDQGLDYFVIERSSDNSNFSRLDTLNATQSFLGLHFYEFKDRHPLPGTSYYRLRMVSFDGKEKLSSSRQVNIQDPYWVHIYPHPADQEMAVELKGLPETTFEVMLMNHSGQPVWRRSGLRAIKGDALVRIPVHQLINGNYVLRISFGQTVISRSVIVQHD